MELKWHRGESRPSTKIKMSLNSRVACNVWKNWIRIARARCWFVLQRNSPSVHFMVHRMRWQWHTWMDEWCARHAHGQPSAIQQQSAESPSFSTNGKMQLKFLFFRLHSVHALMRHRHRRNARSATTERDEKKQCVFQFLFSSLKSRSWAFMPEASSLCELLQTFITFDESIFRCGCCRWAVRLRRVHRMVCVGSKCDFFWTIFNLLWLTSDARFCCYFAAKKTDS